jgi:APA family basic amino acid/polyamine antiporter
VAGLALIAVFAVVHSLHVGTGSRLHNLVTLAKALLIAGLIVAGLSYGDLSRLTSPAEASLAAGLRSPLFGVELMYVSFAYSGWNTAAYLAGEFRRPARDIPWAVVTGTAVVAALYLGLNVVFLAAAPAAALANKEEVASIAAVSLFGERAGEFVTFLIALGLVSTVSSNIMAGPRVYEAMGFDYPALKFLTTRRAGGGPVLAIALQATLAAVLLLTATFDQLITYVSVTLALFATATVLGVLILRRSEPKLPRPYRTWGYPVPPILFLAIELWMIAVAVFQRPSTAAFSAGTIALGLVLYCALRPRRNRMTNDDIRP